jgi:hypothetical protein
VSAREGSPQIIHSRTPGYRRAAVPANVPKAAGSFGTRLQLRPLLAHGGVPMIINDTRMRYRLAWRTASSISG